jgi:death-on-curing protein
MFGLINNHAFVDGNKRIGVVAMQMILEANGFHLVCTNDELSEMALGTASGI